MQKIIDITMLIILIIATVFSIVGLTCGVIGICLDVYTLKRLGLIALGTTVGTGLCYYWVCRISSY